MVKTVLKHCYISFPLPSIMKTLSPEQGDRRRATHQSRHKCVFTFFANKLQENSQLRSHYGLRSHPASPRQFSREFEERPQSLVQYCELTAGGARASVRDQEGNQLASEIMMLLYKNRTSCFNWLQISSFKHSGDLFFRFVNLSMIPDYVVTLSHYLSTTATLHCFQLLRYKS